MTSTTLRQLDIPSRDTILSILALYSLHPSNKTRRLYRDLEARESFGQKALRASPGARMRSPRQQQQTWDHPPRLQPSRRAFVLQRRAILPPRYAGKCLYATTCCCDVADEKLACHSIARRTQMIIFTAPGAICDGGSAAGS